MKLNIAYPATGCQKLIDIEDEKIVRPFYEKRMGQELAADFLGDEWKGYVVRISGGNDKQGFPMKQGVLTNNRVRLLLSKGHSCYRPRRNGERKRKSVRGCIVDSNLSVLALIIVKKGEKEIPGITDSHVPRRLGPKRASKIRRMFNLSKQDDVCRYVIRKPLPIREGTKDKKIKTKAPKIQRLITPSSRQHFRQKRALKVKRSLKNKEEQAEYAKILAIRHKEAQEKKEELKRRRSSQRSSRTSETSVEKVPVKKNVKLAGAATAKAASKAPAKAKATATKEKAPKKDVKALTKEASKAPKPTKKEVKKVVAPPKKAEPAKPAKKVEPAKPTKKAAPAKKAEPSKAKKGGKK